MQIGIVNEGGSSVELLDNVSDAEKRGCTVIRTLVHLWLTPVAGTIVNGSQRLNAGIQLSSDDASS